jgi:hypothetical protein
MNGEQLLKMPSFCDRIRKKKKKDMRGIHLKGTKGESYVRQKYYLIFIEH